MLSGRLCADVDFGDGAALMGAGKWWALGSVGWLAVACTSPAPAVSACGVGDDCPGVGEPADAACDDAASCESSDGCASDADCADGALCGDQFRCVQCRSDDDCPGDLACHADQQCRQPLWRCLSDGYGAPSAEPSFTLTMDVEGLLTEGEVTAMASAQVCADDDPSCGAPLAAGSFDGATLSVSFDDVSAPGFVGAVRITSPEFIDGYFHVPQPLVDSVVTQHSVRVFDQEAYELVDSYSGATGDQANTATLLVRVHDCQGVPASDVGVSPSESPNSVFFALEDERTPKFQSTTTQDGTAIVANVTAGRRVLTLRHEPRGAAASELAQLSFFAHPDAINYIHWYPTHAALMAAQARISTGDSPQVEQDSSDVTGASGKP